MPLAYKIKTCRTELHYTQQELASALGISTRSIAYYESGQRTPSLSRLNIIAKMFRLPLLYLLSDSETDRGDRYIEETYKREIAYGKTH